MDPPIPT